MVPVLERKASSRIDRKYERRLATVLLGVLGDDLIKSNRVVGSGLWIVQGSAGEPHVRARVWVSFGATLVVHAAHEGHVFPEWG